MKRIYLISILLLSLIGKINSQVNSFQEFLNLFEEVQLPLYTINGSLNRESGVFDSGKALSIGDVNKYLYEGKMNSRYYYSSYFFFPEFRWEWNDYHIMLIDRHKDLCGNPYDREYSQWILLIYDKAGDFISREYLFKSGEMWQADFYIEEGNKISIEQIMQLDKDLSTDNSYCYIQSIDYTITNRGAVLKDIKEEKDEVMERGDEWPYRYKRKENPPAVGLGNICTGCYDGDHEHQGMKSDGWITYSLFGDDRSPEGLQTFFGLKMNVKEKDIYSKELGFLVTVYKLQYKGSYIYTCVDLQTNQYIVYDAQIKDKELKLNKDIHVGMSVDAFFDIVWKDVDESIDYSVLESFVNLEKNIEGSRYLQEFNFNKKRKLTQISVESYMKRFLKE